MTTTRRLSRLSRRVKRGAALLDDRCPGWASRIDLDRLDAGSYVHCPLGEVYGSFNAGVLTLGLWAPSIASHGFRCSRLAKWLGLSAQDYLSLTLLWAAEIISRRRKADARRFVPPPKVQAPILV